VAARPVQEAGPRRSRRRAPKRMKKLTTWIALAATAALLAGLGVWLVEWRVEWRAGQPAGAPAGAEPDTGQGVIEQALRQIPGEVDSTELKSRWTDDARGVDLSVLTPAKREIFLRFANAERCTCGCGYTLAGCRAFDPTCPVSGPRVQRLLDSVRAGRAPDAASRPRRLSRRR